MAAGDHLGMQWPNVPNREDVPDEPSPEHPCPVCGSDLPIHFGGHHTLYRGFHVPVTPETENSNDPATLVHALITNAGRGLGTHFTTEHHIAFGTFGAPPPGHIGAVVEVAEPHHREHVPVMPGYSHEKEIEVRPGAPLQIRRVQVYPNPEKFKRDQYDRNLNEAQRHLPTRDVTA